MTKLQQNCCSLAMKDWRLQLSPYRLTRDLKSHYLIKSLMEWYLQFTAVFSRYSKLAGKVSKKHVLNLLVCIYFVTCCSCSSQLSLLVPLYFWYFSVFSLLLEYVKLDNSFRYQVLAEVWMFLNTFIFIIFSMFVCMYFFAFIEKKRCTDKVISRNNLHNRVHQKRNHTCTHWFTRNNEWIHRRHLFLHILYCRIIG